MSTRIEKNTKKLVEKKLDALFSMQQQLNGDASGGTMQWGGNGPAGGYTQQPYNWRNGLQGFGQDNYQTNFGLNPLPQVNQFRPMYTGDLPTNLNIQNTQSSITPQVQTSTFDLTAGAPIGQNLNFGKDARAAMTPGSGGNEPWTFNDYGIPAGKKVSTPNNPSGPVNWGKAGTFAGQMAPMLYNMAKGLQRPTKTRAKYNPYEGNARSLMANRRFNIDPLLEANRTGQAVSNRNISSAANSRGELMANLGASQNYRMRGDSAAWAQKGYMDSVYEGEQAQMDAQFGGQRSQMDWMTQVANEQNEAQTNQFLGQGFNDLGKFTQTQQLMANQAKNSQDLGRIFQDAFGGTVGFMPQIQKILAGWDVTPKTKV